MKLRHVLHRSCAVTVALYSMLPAQTLPPTNSLRGPAVPRFSDLVAWDPLTDTPTAKRVRRDVFDGPTATVD